MPPTRSRKSRRKPLFPCSLCGRVLARPSDLARHMGYHTGERPFECQYCGTAFAQRTTLQNHVLKHQGGFLPCRHCEICFSDRSSRSRHEREKHLPPLFYQCFYRGCTYATVRREGFMRHIKDKHKCLNFSTFYSRAEAEAGLWFMGALAEEEKYYWEERLKEFDFRKIAESDEFRCMVEGTAPPPSPLQLRRASRARRSSRRNSVSKTRRKSRLSVAFANDPPYDPFHLQTDSTYSASPSLPFCESFPVDLDLSASVVNDLLSFGNLAEPLYPFDTTTSLSTPGSSDPFANIDFDGWSWPVLPV